MREGGPPFTLSVHAETRRFAMTTATATHPLPVVHAYETDDEMVVEIELPPHGEGVQIKVDTGVLAVTVPVPHPKRHRWTSPDATPS
jgi:hypothetical protein